METLKQKKIDPGREIQVDMESIRFPSRFQRINARDQRLQNDAR